LWVPLRQADGSLWTGRVVVFVGVIAAERVPDMDQREGAGRLLIGPRSLLLKVNVTPSARLAVGLHAQAAMASGRAEPVTERWAARV
jgi:hypothetical protein